MEMLMENRFIDRLDRNIENMKILVVFTGGTIGSSVNQDGYFAPDKRKAYKLLELYKRYRANSHAAIPTPAGEEPMFDTAEPYTTLSENLGIEHLEMLIRCLEQNLAKDYDGIIVTHGSDTLQYTAAALGYTFGNDTIPIMLVASNYILDDMRANGLDNFAAAVDFICQQAGRGVFVSYRNTGEHTRYHRGTRLQGHPAHTDYLASVDNLFYASHQYGKVIKNREYKECEDALTSPVMSWDSLRTNVLWLQAHPMMTFPKLDGNVKAILISSYHSGTINTASNRWNVYFRSAAESGIPVFLVGAADGMSYESTRGYRENGIQVLPKMAPIAAYMKLLMCTLNGLDLECCMFKSLGGDLL